MKLFNEIGFNTSIKKEKYKWNFDSHESLIDFCYNFFHLKKIEKSKIYDEIQKYLNLAKNNEPILRLFSFHDLSLLYNNFDFDCIKK